MCGEDIGLGSEGQWAFGCLGYALGWGSAGARCMVVLALSTVKSASGPYAFVGGLMHGWKEEECGGGGAGQARRVEGREGPREEALGGATEGNSCPGREGALGEEKRLRNPLTILERSRIIWP